MGDNGLMFQCLTNRNEAGFKDGQCGVTMTLHDLIHSLMGVLRQHGDVHVRVGANVTAAEYWASISRGSLMGAERELRPPVGVITTLHREPQESAADQTWGKERVSDGAGPKVLVL